MERKRKSSKRAWLLGILLGVGLAVTEPYIVRYLQGWLGQIVISAVHQHWLWEQETQLYKPATGLLEVPQGVIY